MHIPKWLVPCLSVALVYAGVGQLRAADTVIDTTTIPTPWNGLKNASEFGVDNVVGATSTYGETVTVPSNGNTLLVSFGFEMDVPTDLIFRAEVYAWSQSATPATSTTTGIATGSSLYQSSATSSTVFTPAGTAYQLINFSPAGGLNLTAGQMYILMITASVSPDYTTNYNANGGNGAGGGYVGSPNNPSNAYTGGNFWYIDDDGDPAQWTSDTAVNPVTMATASWQNDIAINVDNLAFRADFSAGTGAVPLPAALPAGTMGLVMAGGMLSMRRMRARA